MLLIIGIDPDLTASGVAVITPDKRIVEMQRVKFSQLVDYMQLQAIKADGQILIKMEDPNMIAPTFPRALPKAMNRQAVNNRISQNVGQVKAVATLILEVLKAAGYSVTPCRPLVGGYKTRCKKDAAYFNQLTGWDKRSNEDCRDAALIALFGG
ncbi:hypothetical protein [Arsukibacterium indicum]|uniref:Uncharacterized protein n=1 Tax=Arsukibacterium indicum TaxID=2848612 RepID=A0ABS6MGK2_9GAMM|nr:hypothetical protein [Arsukibacterium indicum]MBV2127938.1 hypothetical protein [Arsukibacterium indicum]